MRLASALFRYPVYHSGVKTGLGAPVFKLLESGCYVWDNLTSRYRRSFGLSKWTIS